MSSNSFTVTYVPEPTTTSISAAPSSSTLGDPVTYAATVRSPGPAPTGSVTFTDGSTTLCTASISGGTGSCSATNAPLGASSVHGQYSGDANSSGSAGTTGISVGPPHGYWLVGSDGGIFSFGAAQFHGSTGSLKLQRPVVGIVPTRDDNGYWLDASDGGIFSYGDSQFYGSIPGLGIHPSGSGLPNSLDAPIVGMVPSADDGGYFMVGADGGVFAFGDAHFAGAAPASAAARCGRRGDAGREGGGYWVVTQTGHVYTFGDAPYYGAPGPQGVAVTSAVRTPDGRGYWILFANGAISTFGDAGELRQPGRPDWWPEPRHRHLHHGGRGRLLGCDGQWRRRQLRGCSERRLDGRHEPQRFDHRRHGLVGRLR